MSLFGTNICTVTRAEGEHQNHEWVNTIVTPDFEIAGTVQPFGGNELKSLDIGRKTEDVQCLICYDELITAKLVETPEFKNYKPDVVTDNETGIKYEVVSIANCHSKILPHYEYVLAELSSE